MIWTNGLFGYFARVVALLGLLAWALGSVWALWLQAPSLFYRFGALGVAASVLFFTDQLLKIELARQRSVERLLHDYGIQIQAIRAGQPAKTDLIAGDAFNVHTEDKNFDTLRRSADRVQTANIGLLTLSTLQWGFGDLLLTYVLPGGAN